MALVQGLLVAVGQPANDLRDPMDVALGRGFPYKYKPLPKPVPGPVAGVAAL